MCMFINHLIHIYIYMHACVCATVQVIEGLEGCPGLQRLWLFSNRIASLAGLQHTGGLKELWAQDNDVSSTAGVETLSQLESLALAGNPIGTQLLV
jgi:Leucine-rich repeat (LRR) protein